jgi:MFS family permease
MIKKKRAFIFGTLITYLIAVPCVSLFNIASIVDLGYPVPFASRIGTVAHDIPGMVSLYMPIIAVALLIGWLFTGLLLTRFIQRTAFIYALAGFTALVAVHMILHALLGLSGIAATRTLAGLLAQGVAGGFGGWAFYTCAFRAANKPAAE